MSKQTSLFSVAICLSIFVCSCTPQPQMHCYWYDPNTGRVMTEAEYQEWKATQEREKQHRIWWQNEVLRAQQEFAKETQQLKEQAEKNHETNMAMLALAEKIVAPTQKQLSKKGTNKKNSFVEKQLKSADEPHNSPNTSDKWLPRLYELYEQVRVGIPSAQFELGMLLIQGEVLPQNDIEGMELIRKSSLNDYQPAIDYLNKLSQDSFDKLYIDAKSGNAKAQYDLGIKLIQGDGIPKNTTEGLEWIRKSSKHGYKKSRDFMEKLYLESRKGFNQ